MSYSFFVLRFLLFILLNFFFLFQSFFSLSFFFSSKIDEELIICLAIFFVFILFINHIIAGLQDMLKSKIDIYTSLFLLIFKILRKSLKRLRKHEQKAVLARGVLFSFFYTTFSQNLFAYNNFQVSLNNFLIQMRLRIIFDSIMADIELKSFSKKRSLAFAYDREFNYFKFVKLLKG